jgi:mannitol-specific phosphotransferase system IIBC component
MSTRTRATSSNQNERVARAQQAEMSIRTRQTSPNQNERVARAQQAEMSTRTRQTSSNQNDRVARAHQAEKTATAIQTAQLTHAMFVAQKGSAAQAASTLKGVEIAQLNQAVQDLQATQALQVEEHIASLSRKLAYAEIRIIKLETQLGDLRRVVDDLAGKRESPGDAVEPSAKRTKNT